MSAESFVAAFPWRYAFFFGVLRVLRGSLFLVSFMPRVTFSSEPRDEREAAAPRIWSYGIASSPRGAGEWQQPLRRPGGRKQSKRTLRGVQVRSLTPGAPTDEKNNHAIAQIRLFMRIGTHVGGFSAGLRWWIKIRTHMGSPLAWAHRRNKNSWHRLKHLYTAYYCA